MKKMLEFDENDKLFIGDNVLKDFGNCLDCGLCCKLFDYIEIADEEIQSIAQYLKITQKDFRKKYTKNNRKQNALTKTSLKTPCHFQRLSKCTIQKRKPFDCKTFPLFINITKGQAILTGIYLCPQATHFYQGFLEFCQHYNRSLYDILISLEQKAPWTSLGLELTLPSKPLGCYIDWLSADTETRKHRTKT